MIKRKDIETIVGAIIIVMLCLITYSIYEYKLYDHKSYTLHGKLTSAEGLKYGSIVKISGVQVGYVNNIKLDKKDNNAIVSLTINYGISIPNDSMLIIESPTLMEDRIVNIKIGYSEKSLKDGSYIHKTRSPKSLDDMIADVMTNFGS